MRILRRILVMSLLGASGAFVGALAGERLFREAAPLEAPVRDRDVCLVFDMSSSMLDITKEGESQLEALRRAALQFVASDGFKNDRLSLVAFSTGAHVVCEPTHDVEQLRGAIQSLRAGGMTEIGRGLEVAQDVLASAKDESWILLFSDGKPKSNSIKSDPVLHARRAATECRNAGIQIAAVGTGLADKALFEELTGDPANVFLSAPESLGQAFEATGELIQNKQMLTSSTSSTDFVTGLLHACAWAGLVACGAGLALVVGVNRGLRRRFLRVGQFFGVLFGAVVSGAAAGAAGQGTYHTLSQFEAPELPGRIVAWVLLAASIALGMTFFVPNLPRRRATFAGAVGGALAAVCFLRIVPGTGDTGGRLLGAAILGLVVGAMIVLVETSVRRARLLVHWGKGETSKLLLGSTPIIVGRSAEAHICPSWDENLPELIGLFTRDSAGSQYEDKRTGMKRRLRAGDRLDFGKVVVEVQDAEDEGTARSTGEPQAPPTRSTSAAGSSTPRAPQPRAPLPGRSSAGAPPQRKKYST
jgi:uncharacterized protein YegL